MKDFIGIGILAGVALYLYEMFGKASVNPLPGSTVTNTPVTGSGVNPIVAGATGVTVVTTPQNQANATQTTSWGTIPVSQNFTANTNNIGLTLVNSAAAAGYGMTDLTFDQWNYFYNKIYGTYLQAPSGLNTTTEKISIYQFLSASGLSGLGGLNGLGMIDSAIDSSGNSRLGEISTVRLGVGLGAIGVGRVITQSERLYTRNGGMVRRVPSIMGRAYEIGY